MNHANNERFQATERKIMDAFIQLLSRQELSEITVSEICRVCGIHRTSFYLHFQDVYGLMDVMERRLGEDYVSLQEENDTMGCQFQRLFSFLYDHQDFYRAYWLQARDLSILDAALSPRAEEPMTGQAAARRGFQTEEELHYHRVFFKAGLAALTGCWLSRGCPEAPEELGKILEREYQTRMDRGGVPGQTAEQDRRTDYV